MKKLLLISALLLILAGCAKNPFATRESEDPFTPAGTFVPPTSPQIVLENLKLAYSELVISNFIQTLDSNFIFRFDYAAGVIIDSTWGFAVEVNLTENLFNDVLLARGSRVLHVEFDPQPGQDDIVLDTTATLIRGYSVGISDSLGNELEHYQGVAEFEMIESSFNYWTLLAWEDYHLESDTRSWADLKTSYR